MESDTFFVAIPDRPGCHYVCDPAAKLTHGCRVAVRFRVAGGQLSNQARTGTLLTKRPVPFRRIKVRIDHSYNRGIWGGTRDDDWQVARVTGVLERI